MIPCLLLHGALGTAAQLQPLLDQLPADWPVFTLNFPGHGGAFTDQPFSMRLFTDAILRFMEERQLPAVNIFGYSMGGYVALGLAAEQPDRVQRIVTLGTRLDWSPGVAAGMSRMFDPEKIEAKVPQFGLLLAQAHAPDDWKVVCQRTARFLADLGDGLGLAEDSFSRITCPVTIGWGELDNVVTEEESRRAAAQIPNGKFERLEGVQHAFEQVDLVRLAQFLEAEFNPVVKARPCP
ncbi:MAG: alpha/beta hydrolase [Saprospiraceae bacterium]